jgi:hypothetical protein
MSQTTNGVCYSDYSDTKPAASLLAAEVAAAQGVVIELRQLLDRFSIHLETATRIFDASVSHTIDDSWIELCHGTGVAALWMAVADFRSTLEIAVERASGRNEASR